MYRVDSVLVGEFSHSSFFGNLVSASSSAFHLLSSVCVSTGSFSCLLLEVGVRTRDRLFERMFPLHSGVQVGLCGCSGQSHA